MINFTQSLVHASKKKDRHGIPTAKMHSFEKTRLNCPRINISSTYFLSSRVWTIRNVQNAMMISYLKVVLDQDRSKVVEKRWLILLQGQTWSRPIMTKIALSAPSQSHTSVSNGLSLQYLTLLVNVSSKAMKDLQVRPRDGWNESEPFWHGLVEFDF